MVNFTSWIYCVDFDVKHFKQDKRQLFQDKTNILTVTSNKCVLKFMELRTRGLQEDIKENKKPFKNLKHKINLYKFFFNSFLAN